MPLIVLDPGHGGRDPGALGRSLREKDINLQVCLYLKSALERCSFRVVLTRDRDTERVPGVATGVDLKARAMLANTNGADLYLSWHYDASEKPEVAGLSVWIHPSQKDQPAYTKAELLADQITQHSGQRNRGVYFGDFQVLRDTHMDAVLIEGGFLTNPEEETWLADPTFLHKQAEGAARALCRLYGLPYQQASTDDPKPYPLTDLVTIKLSGSDLHQRGRLIDGRTYVPIRDLAEALGCSLNWDGSTQTVTITRGG